jgi:hypothetical protein
MNAEMVARIIQLILAAVVMVSAYAILQIEPGKPVGGSGRSSHRL